MSQKTTTVFKDILLVLAILCLIFVGYYTYAMNKSYKEYINKHVDETKIGMDSELSTTVDSLEQALVERSNLKFHATSDPLDLTKIIINIPPEVLAIQEKELEEKEKKGLIKKSELKLTATIISKDGNSAVFYYMGKNVTLKEGQTVDDKKIISITDGSVIVEESGVRKTYNTK